MCVYCNDPRQIKISLHFHFKISNQEKKYMKIITLTKKRKNHKKERKKEETEPVSFLLP